MGSFNKIFGSGPSEPLRMDAVDTKRSKWSSRTLPVFPSLGLLAHDDDDEQLTNSQETWRLSKGPSVSREAYPDNLAHHPELGVPGGSITSLSSKKGIELIKTRRAEALAKVDERAEQYMQALQHVREQLQAEKRRPIRMESDPCLPATEDEPLLAKPPVARAQTCCCFNGLVSKVLPEVDLPFESPQNAVIIFDWDDTLFPTAELVQNLFPSLPSEAVLGKDNACQVPKESPYYEALAAHGRLLTFVLRASRRVARVAIVTLSDAPWVEASAARFLPGLDMKELLNELRIPVYHARQHLAKCNVNVRHAVTLGRLDSPIGIILEPMSDGSAEIYDVECQGAVPEWNAKNAPMEVRSGDRVVEVNGRRGTLQEPITIILEREMARNNAIRLTVMKDREMGKRVGAKLISMKQACGKFYGSRRGHWNVLSVGDSVVERIALRMLLGGKAALKLHKVCKTLKVADLPCLEDLANELRFMMVCIPRILSANHPLDIHMDNPDDLETDIFSQI